jgi:hypothetical protein
MKRSVKFILLITTITTMLSLEASGEPQLGKPTVIAAPHPTAIRSVPVRVSVQRINKPKIFVGNPHKITLFADDRDDDFLEIDDIITAYRREDLQKIHTDATEDNPDGLSEYIQWRLFLARQLALMKYRETHS